MLLWAGQNGLELPGRLASYRDRVVQLPSAQKAMSHEGLT